MEVVIQLPEFVNTQKFVTLGYTKKSDFYCTQIYLNIKANLKKFKKKSGLGQWYRVYSGVEKLMLTNNCFNI